MVRVTYVDSSGSSRQVTAHDGETLMAAAVRNGVPGIVGQCGGSATCATCHVYVREDQLDLVGPPNELEDDMLDLAVTERRPTSRLGCQVVADSKLDGLCVDIPDVQP